MTEQAWQEYIVVFLEEIRQALPTAEIVHNSIWFAGGTSRWNNPLVQREIASADCINLERGVNDGGLVGGEGPWSLRSLFSFIDSVHAAGEGVVLDGFDASPAGREYSLASYLLVSSGNDGIGLASITPENWWPAYGIDLGRRWVRDTNGKACCVAISPAGSRSSRNRTWRAVPSFCPAPCSRPQACL